MRGRKTSKSGYCCRWAAATCSCFGCVLRQNQAGPGEPIGRPDCWHLMEASRIKECNKETRNAHSRISWKRPSWKRFGHHHSDRQDIAAEMLGKCNAILLCGRNQHVTACDIWSKAIQQSAEREKKPVGIQ